MSDSTAFSSSNETSSPSTDLFEVLVATLLGLAAIGAALAGYQEGLWGGKSVEAYGESSVMSTAATSTYNDELTTYMSDGQIDVEAKKAIWVGLDTDDEVEATRSLELASYLYLYRVSDAAYKHLGLPAAEREKAAASDEAVVLTEDQLAAALETDLEEAYEEDVFSASADEFEDAEVKFDEGRVANANGDAFSLAGVVFTISLFFAGLALVFKTKIRWTFFGAGVLVFAGAGLYLATLAWTS